jgi:hypothetical protein
MPKAKPGGKILFEFVVAKPMCLMSKTNVFPGIKDKVSGIQTNVSQVPNQSGGWFDPISRMVKLKMRQNALSKTWRKNSL